jgi:hypothetical protein
MVSEISHEQSFINSSKSNITVIRGIVKKRRVIECKNNNQDFFYMDTGYFGNFICQGNPSGKKKWQRIVKNELQKTVIHKCPSDRWESLVKQDNRLKWKGWKKGGRNILLILPNPKSCVFFDIDYNTWYKNTISEIKKNTDRPIVERIKGSRGNRNTYTIYDALNDDTFAVVAFNSIAAIESIAYGIPSFVSVPCAAYPLANKDLSSIENPFMPDEEIVQQHCRSLAYGQFTREEIDNGTAWKILNTNYEIINQR